jgi:hypothetical protein
MPMTPSGLSAVIKTQLEAEFGTPTDPVREQKFCDAMGEAIVTYIQANALVSTNDTGTVTGGVASGDPVVATGVGTVS